jgi:hypothetical protein
VIVVTVTVVGARLSRRRFCFPLGTRASVGARVSSRPRPDAVAMTKARKRPKCGKINFRAAAAEMAAKGVSNEPEARSIQSLSL